MGIQGVHGYTGYTGCTWVYRVYRLDRVYRVYMGIQVYIGIQGIQGLHGYTGIHRYTGYTGQSAKTADWLVDNDVIWRVLRNSACANPRKLKDRSKHGGCTVAHICKHNKQFLNTHYLTTYF